MKLSFALYVPSVSERRASMNCLSDLTYSDLYSSSANTAHTEKYLGDIHIFIDYFMDYIFIVNTFNTNTYKNRPPNGGL